MKNFIKIMLLPILLILVAPVYAGTAVHVLHCEQDDDASNKDLNNLMSAWLKDAKTMKGGKGLEVYLYFPIAAQMGETDFMVLIKAPSVSEWGQFMDGYEGSAAQSHDADWDELAACADSSLWQSVTIK